MTTTSSRTRTSNVATADQVAQVRLNTDEPTDAAPYTNAVLGAWVDELGVDGASARIWQQKAASYAKLVNTSEGDARRDLSDLFDHASGMVSTFGAAAATVATAASGLRIKQIDRTS